MENSLEILDNDEPVSWMSDRSYALLNPKGDALSKKVLESSLFPKAPSHIWIRSSGTCHLGQTKWIGISKRALLNSAASVNQRISSHSKDCWLSLLPRHHVGGLSIDARAFLSGASVVRPKNWKWSTYKFGEILDSHEVTLCSLVPTQVHDLVKDQMKPSKNSSLRAIFVGGGALSKSLYLKARSLGWNLLPTYGMTECGSQIATASLESLLNQKKFPPMLRLRHLEISTDSSGLLRVRGSSLFSYHLWIDHKTQKVELQSRSMDEWYVTEDRVHISGDNVSFLGRADDLVKVGGELVSFFRLNQVLQEVCLGLGMSSQVMLVPVPEERLEFQVELFFEPMKEELLQNVISEFNKIVFPYERIKKSHEVSKIEQTSLGKLKSPVRRNVLPS